MNLCKVPKVPITATEFTQIFVTFNVPLFHSRCGRVVLQLPEMLKCNNNNGRRKKQKKAKIER
jgi:hypothetical protein